MVEKFDGKKTQTFNRSYKATAQDVLRVKNGVYKLLQRPENESGTVKIGETVVRFVYQKALSSSNTSLVIRKKA